jgi:putative glycosyltransferase (TIGR04372 family)
MTETLQARCRKFIQLGWSARIKMVFNGLRRYLLLPLPKLFFKWIMLPLLGFWTIRKIRIGFLIYSRIGHLSLNTELFLRRRHVDEDLQKQFHIFITGKPANRQLLKMIRRRVPVIESHLLYQMMDLVKEREGMFIELPHANSSYYEFNNIPPQLSFSEQEEEKGEELLRSMGIEPGSPFVCFHARDKVYLDTTLTYRDWSYHDHRDSDIMNCLPAAQYLASQEMYTIRMGYKVESALPKTDPRIIDYATHHRTDFGDIYLAAKCEFFIGSTAGITGIPLIFNRPMAYVNFMPLGGAGVADSNLFIVKKHWHVKEKRLLSFKQVFAMGADLWTDGDQFKNGGLEVIEHTADEILALIKEMYGRYKGMWVYSEEDEELQNRYRALFPPGHQCIGFGSRMGAEFLRQNLELLD